MWLGLAGRRCRSRGVVALVFLKTAAGGGGHRGGRREDRRRPAAGAGQRRSGGRRGLAAWRSSASSTPGSGDRRRVVAVRLPVPVRAFAARRVAYADTLNVRRPWDGAFWLLPVVVGVLLLARRHAVSRTLAGFAVGVLAVAAADIADEIWDLVQEDDAQPESRHRHFSPGS